VDLLGWLIGGPHWFGRRVSLELSGMMQSSRRFQWWSGRPGQSDTADSRSYLLLLLRATHGFSGVGGLSRGAESEDAIVDTVVGRYDINKAITLYRNTGFFIYRSVRD